MRLLQTTHWQKAGIARPAKLFVRPLGAKNEPGAPAFVMHPTGKGRRHTPANDFSASVDSFHEVKSLIITEFGSKGQICVEGPAVNPLWIVPGYHACWLP